MSRELILAKRESLRDRYESGELSLDDYVAGDEALAAITGADTEAKMKPILDRWNADLKKVRREKFSHFTGGYVGAKRRTWSR